MSIMRHGGIQIPPTSGESSNSGPQPLGSNSPLSLRDLFSSNYFSWRALGGLFASLLVVGWIFIIVILIQEEKWQLVLVAWLLLYAAAHFCYWYFKRHHLLSIRSQICRRTRGNVGSMVSPTEKGKDEPPSYEEILKTEVPPPAYYSVVAEDCQPSPGKKSPFSIPRVFGGGSANHCRNGVSPIPSQSHPPQYVHKTPIKLTNKKEKIPHPLTPHFTGIGPSSLSSSVDKATSADNKQPLQQKRSLPPSYLSLTQPSTSSTNILETRPSSSVAGRGARSTINSNDTIASTSANTPEQPILLPIYNCIGVVDDPTDSPIDLEKAQSTILKSRNIE